MDKKVTYKLSADGEALKKALPTAKIKCKGKEYIISSLTQADMKALADTQYVDTND